MIGAIFVFTYFAYLLARIFLVPILLKYNILNELKLANKVKYPLLHAIKVRLYAKLFKNVPAGNSVDVFIATAEKNPSKPAVVFTKDGSVLTYRQLDKYSTKIANYILAKIPDVVTKKSPILAVMLNNSPDFLAVWIALWKLGVSVAFINTNLKTHSLIHVLKVSNASHLIVGEEFVDTVKESSEIPLILFGNDEAKKGIVFTLSEKVLEKSSDGKVKSELKDRVGPFDLGLLIFTSGTTGLPKAAKVPHEKFLLLANLGGFFDINGVDRIMTCLPLYHSAASVISWGHCMKTGATLVLSPKFSASRFFKDCTEFKVSAIQYIGELCRYLLNSPPGDFDNKHSLRIAFGNGLGPEIWKTFKKRFNISEIGEFYASTEGNSGIINHQIGDVGIGSVGRAGPLLRSIIKMVLVRYDVETDSHIKDENGFFIQCEPGQVGELISLISRGHLTRDFVGYHGNDKATNSKILTNVFKKGDEWFRTGDLLTMDKDYFFYFKDRIGDTFRWKGENVSTKEVSQILTKYPGIVESNVYGIQIPTVSTGRACMAAIRSEKKIFKISGLYEYLNEHLASYCVPLFIRILKGEMNQTGTFKQIKFGLQKQGCDYKELLEGEELFWLKGEEYVKFGKEEYSEVVEGKVRF